MSKAIRSFRAKKPKRSIRTIVIAWFLLLSLLPLVFVAYYSTVKYEQAIDRELQQRLSVNTRELEIIFSDIRSGFQIKKERFLKDPNLIYNISVSDISNLINIGNQQLSQDISNELIFYNREGRRVLKLIKGLDGSISTEMPKEEVTFLSEKYIGFLKSNKDIPLLEFENDDAVISLLSRVLYQNRKIVGFIQQRIQVNENFLAKLKNKLKLELLLMKEDMTPLSSSFKFASNKEFSGKIRNALLSQEPILDLKVKGNPYGFYFKNLEWGHSRLILGVGASKSDSQQVLKTINIAYLSVVGTVVLLLIVTVIITSQWILRPLYQLLEAIQSFEAQDQVITIPIRNNTEIGLLTESFNQMSTKISQARSELKNKVAELEKTNQELRETQKRLVHSAKMVSLGELVAGVAHELNNPISFIYSNMSHLRDYSNRLINLIKTAESDPNGLSKAKIENEFEYIVQDLPKLITSCEEGARRTRDIVLGLRNFSRIDEGQIAEIDIHESLETTLSLLASEIKNKITVVKNFDRLPRIKCYSTQLNQVFVNIISNAIQAIESNGNIWITTEFDRSGFIRISIQDSGKGISSEHLEKIFDPFFTTKAVGLGTGLGLSITYGIIQKHGGDITVKSELGKGTEFIISLPIEPKLQKPKNN